VTRSIVLTNHKGGVGKSTSATTIALGLSALLRQAGAQNSRVLLIDTDSQSHATLVTTGRDFGKDDSLYAVLMAERGDAPQVLADVIKQSTWTPDLKDKLWKSEAYRQWRAEFFGLDDPLHVPHETEIPF